MCWELKSLLSLVSFVKHFVLVILLVVHVCITLKGPECQDSLLLFYQLLRFSHFQVPGLPVVNQSLICYVKEQQQGFRPWERGSGARSARVTDACSFLSKCLHTNRVVVTDIAWLSQGYLLLPCLLGNAEASAELFWSFRCGNSFPALSHASSVQPCIVLTTFIKLHFRLTWQYKLFACFAIITAVLLFQTVLQSYIQFPMVY